ncbi:MAG: hypothetical protein J6T49_00795 [Bacteroidales bacterium]|nr:hypothetical protein [Bacteroidales bacterium]MBO7478982.1 hypothetical protein [Bacteroidales bacterium]MBO7487403.1 hypothetical protein [Bacteroidales bacterium]
MDTWKNYFTEISAGESVLIVGGVDGSLKELLYNLAFFVGRFVRLIFGPKLPV